MQAQNSWQQRMSVEQQIKPAILLIATGKYSQFVEPLIRKIDKWFMPHREIAVVVFSPYQILPRTTSRVNMVWTKIEDYRWPYATLYRYKIFSNISEYLRKFTHLYYMDVDMNIIDEIGDEFLVNGLLAIRHPGCYAADRWGSPNTDPISTAYLPISEQQHYYCGGVQGGLAEMYLKVAKQLAENIDIDEKNRVMAEWHDETHWNKAISQNMHMVTELSPAYCMPESVEARMSWGLSEFKPKILALDKNHAEIRS